MRAFLYARKRMVNTLVKLIVSDMDGTLVDDDKNIDTEIFELLPKLKAAGGCQRQTVPKPAGRFP